MKFPTSIDVLHLWKFNTKYRGDKLIMILYIFWLLEIMITEDSKAEEKKKNSLVNIEQTPLRGHLLWSRGCPLDRGSTV